MCKNRGCRYVPARHHDKIVKDKLLAVWFYLHSLPFRTIVNMLNVSHLAVFDWVKMYARENYIEFDPSDKAVILEIDEMWHYLHSQIENAEYGRLIAVIPINLSTGNAVDATILHFQGFEKE